MWWDMALTFNVHCVSCCLMVVLLQQHGRVSSIGPFTVCVYRPLKLDVSAFYTAPIIFLTLSYKKSIDQLIVTLFSSAVATVYITASSEIGGS
jgi:hypothetical protein